MNIQSTQNKRFLESHANAPLPKRQKVYGKFEEIHVHPLERNSPLLQNIEILTNTAFEHLIQSQENMGQMYILAALPNAEGKLEYVDAKQLQKNDHINPFTQAKVQQVYYFTLIPNSKTFDYLGCYQKESQDKAENLRLKAFLKDTIDCGEVYCQRGYAYFNNMENEGHLKQAIQFFNQGHKYENLFAAYMLAKCKSQGLGIEVDLEAASELHIEIINDLSRATAISPQFLNEIIKDAEQGDFLAQFLYACLQQRGVGVGKDTKAAFDTLSKLAERQFLPALLRQTLYFLAGQEVEKDVLVAKKMLTYATECNYRPAIVTHAKCLLQGVYGEKDTSQGIALLQLAAKLNSPSAHEELAKYMLRGDELPKDPKGAFELLSSTKCVDVKLQALLADFYFKGTGTPINRAKALELFRFCAYKGDAFSQRMLGVYHLNGWGLPKNAQAAVELFSKAAKQDDVVAFYYLGNCLQKGDGISVDLKAAVESYRKAAEKGFFPAQYELAVCQEKGLGTSVNLLEAAKGYEAAAKKNYSKAFYALGRCYQFGIGFKPDLKAAVHNYQLGCTANCSLAKRELALCLLNGNGVAQDAVAGVNLLSKVAEQGDAIALNELGYCYQHGIGINQDRETALKCYAKSANRGLPEAYLNCGVLRLEDIKSQPTALINFMVAAESGLPAAHYNLGLCLEYGWGTQVDLEAAEHHYQCAAQHQHTAARIKLRQPPFKAPKS